MTGHTYDTGVLIAAERNERFVWALHRRLLDQGNVAGSSIDGAGMRSVKLRRLGVPPRALSRPQSD